jgi:hypothetical protein
MKTFLFTYRYEGDSYSLEIPADTLAEAKGRLSAMAFARYDGELKATVNLPRLPSWLASWLPKANG